jgi:hypothetical protein
MKKTVAFIPGLTLGRMFFHEIGRSIIESLVPHDAYAAAFTGSGSDVLGYDSVTSTDHHWGPRFQVFLAEHMEADTAGLLDRELQRRLPDVFHGFAARFSDPDHFNGGTPPPAPPGDGLAHHLIEITTVRVFFQRCLGTDILGSIGPRDWLTFPEQRLLELTSGEVFHDPSGELSRLRGMLAVYPRDVWLYRMACQWQRLSRQEAFIGRCAEAGDPLGMKIVAGRITRDAMKLCFLMEKTYAPYDKWLGSAFRKLRCAAKVTPCLFGALEGRDFAALEENLLSLYETLGTMHNSLGVTGPLDIAPRRFFSRPFLVIGAERFTNALLRAIECEELRSVSVRIGAIDQYGDSTDFIESVAMYRRTLGLYY